VGTQEVPSLKQCYAALAAYIEHLIKPADTLIQLIVLKSVVKVKFSYVDLQGVANYNNVP
jgi:hypothetical protein